MRKFDKFYIDGQWVDPVAPNDFNVYNPATADVCATISLGSSPTQIASVWVMDSRSMIPKVSLALFATRTAPILSAYERAVGH